MAGRLAGRVALVTGSGRGLGRHYAEHLAGLGADVVVHDESHEAPARFGEADDLEAVAEGIRRLGVRCLAVIADVRDPRALRAATAAARARMGRIDLLVNNAGGDIGAVSDRPEPNDALTIGDEDVQAVVDRNLTGTIHACRAVAPVMIEQGGGSIVNVSSIAAVVSTTNGVVYAAAKAGIIHYTRCLARQLRPYDITVNCLSPGPTVTARFLRTRDVSEDALAASEGLDRLGQPADQARALEFLLTDGYVSGQNIVVDGARAP